MDSPNHLHRFFVELARPVNRFPFPVTLKDEFSVDHIRKVLRLKASDQIIVIDGEREVEFFATITEVSKTSVSLKLLSQINRENQDARLPNVMMGAAVIREQRWDWMLQKNTELGIRVIVPIGAQRCVVKMTDPVKKQARWKDVARSAAEQSEGLFIPRIEMPSTLEKFCRSSAEIKHKVFLMERGQDRIPLKEYLRKTKMPDELAVAIGPEGGWSEEEVELLMKQGFQPVSLGARILRSETAAVSFMSALVYEFDEFDSVQNKQSG